MVWKDLKIRYKQTLLGAGWAVLQPLLTMIVFNLFFGKLAQMPSDGIPYPVFSFSALLPWTYFSGTIALAGNSMISNKNLITKVYFPRLTVPTSAVLSGLLDFAIAFVVLLILLIYYQIVPNWKLLLWPLLLVPLVILTLGVGMFLAALNVKYRDVKYIIPFIVQLWLFLTPIIYPASIIPERFRFLMALNPLAGLIEAFRSSFLPAGQMNWQILGLSLLMIGVIFVVALLYFKKTEREFADII